LGELRNDRWQRLDGVLGETLRQVLVVFFHMGRDSVEPNVLAEGTGEFVLSDLHGL
jgi:hypothetical protein